MGKNLHNEYRHNSEFRVYVDKYCKMHDITVEEALEHELVKQVAEQYREKEVRHEIKRD